MTNARSGCTNIGGVKFLTCALCGLPIAGVETSEPAYCCSGCAIVASMIGPVEAGARPEVRDSRSLILRLGLAGFFSANVMVLSLFLYSLDTSGTRDTVPPAALALVNVLLVCFGAPVFVLLAPPYLAGLGRDLRRRRFSTDSLIAIGSAAAGAGIAVSNGTDIAREVAEAVFLKGGLWRLPRLVELARLTRRVARQNLGWAFGYNVVAVGFAAAGMLRPILAAALMLVSSIAVTANAFRVRNAHTGL